MAYLELHPGTVYEETTLQTGPVWDDASDTTSTTRTLPAGGSNSHMRGWLDASTLDPTLVTDIAIVARYKAETTEDATDFPIVMAILFDNPGGGVSAPFTDVLVPRYVHSQPVITEDQWFLSDDDYALIGCDRTEVAQRLTRVPTDPIASGMRCLDFGFLVGSLTPPDSGTRTLTVYEASIRLYYNESTVVIGSDLLAATPVTRLWPRDDNLGLGTASRIHPPPRANRIIGGQP